jgi:hypothetical protein
VPFALLLDGAGRRSAAKLVSKDEARRITAGRHGDLGRLPPRPQGLGAGGTALG